MNRSVSIEGMSCAHCQAAVEKALLAVPGVQSVQVDLTAKTATVQIEDHITDTALRSAVEEAGYTVVGIE